MSKYDSIQVTNIAVTAVFGGLATVSLCLRIIARLIQRVEIAWSEYLMVLSWFFVSCAIACNYVAIAFGGLGRHQETLSLEQTGIYLKAIFALQILWALAEGAVKVSMCLLYCQIFPQRNFHLAARGVMALCAAFSLAVILSTVFICSPVAYSWDTTIEGARCGDRVGMWVAVGILNIVTDLSVVFLPAFMVLQCSLRTSKKIGLYIIFGLGAVVCIISGIRLKFLLQVQFGGDAAYEIAVANIWSILEPTAAISFGCIPTIKPVWIRLFRGKETYQNSRPAGYDDYESQMHAARQLRWVDGGHGYNRNSTKYDYPLTESSATVVDADDADEKRLSALYRWHEEGKSLGSAGSASGVSAAAGRRAGAIEATQ